MDVISLLFPCSSNAESITSSNLDDDDVFGEGKKPRNAAEEIEGLELEGWILWIYPHSFENKLTEGTSC